MTRFNFNFETAILGILLFFSFLPLVLIYLLPIEKQSEVSSDINSQQKLFTFHLLMQDLETQIQGERKNVKNISQKISYQSTQIDQWENFLLKKLPQAIDVQVFPKEKKLSTEILLFPLNSEKKHLLTQFSFPLEKGGETLGHVRIHVRIKNFENQLEIAPLNGDNSLIIMDREGVPLWKRGVILEQSTGTFFSTQAGKKISDDGEKRGFWKGFLFGEIVSMTYLWNSNLNVYLVLLEPDISSAKAFPLSFFFSIIFWMLILLLGFPTVGVYLMRRITKNIRDMESFVSSVSGGNFDGQLPPSRFKELQKLRKGLLEMQKEIKDRISSMKKLFQKETSILEMERIRVSKELHDLILQQITFLNMNLEKGAECIIGECFIQQKRESLTNLLKNTNRTGELILSDLSLLLLEKKDLAGAIRELLYSLRLSFPDLEFHNELETIEGLSYGEELILYRAAQEGVNNVIKHSDTSSFSVCLGNYPDYCLLEIHDEGKGFELEKVDFNTQLGLISMTDSLASIGAVLDLESYLGEGTFLTIRKNKKKEEERNEKLKTTPPPEEGDGYLYEAE